MSKNRDLSILTEKQRQAYVLRQNGETLQQIANIMNITTEAAKIAAPPLKYALKSTIYI